MASGAPEQASPLVPNCASMAAAPLVSEILPDGECGFGVRIVSYKPVLIAAPGLSVDSLRSPERADCRHRATPIIGITLSDEERRGRTRADPPN